MTKAVGRFVKEMVVGIAMTSEKIQFGAVKIL